MKRLNRWHGALHASAGMAFVMCGVLLAFFASAARAQEIPVAVSAQAPGDVNALKFNEFMAVNDGSVIDPADPDPQDGDDDWLEIYNPSAVAVDLQGLYISDSIDELTKHAFTQSLVISPGGFLVIWADDEPEQGPNHLPFKLSGDGEALVLVAADGVSVIDSYTFGPQEDGVSEGRLPDGGPTWVKFPSSPTPGRSNMVAPTILAVQHQPLLPQANEPVQVSATITDDGTIAAATLFYRVDGGNWISLTMNTEEENHYVVDIPGQPDDALVDYYIEAQDDSGDITYHPTDAPDQTRRYLVGYEAPAIRINELMAENNSTLEDPDELDEYPDWFELYNAGTEPVDLSGYHLTDDLSSPTRFTIPAGITLQPGAFLLFFADDDPSQGSNHVNFRLEKSGETLAIFEPNGAAPVDYIDFGQQRGDAAYGRYPDGEDAWGDPLCATPGEPNILCNRQLYMPTALNNASPTSGANVYQAAAP